MDDSLDLANLCHAHSEYWARASDQLSSYCRIAAGMLRYRRFGRPARETAIELADTLLDYSDRYEIYRDRFIVRCEYSPEESDRLAEDRHKVWEVANETAELIAIAEQMVLRDVDTDFSQRFDAASDLRPPSRVTREVRDYALKVWNRLVSPFSIGDGAEQHCGLPRQPMVSWTYSMSYDYQDRPNRVALPVVDMTRPDTWCLLTHEIAHGLIRLALDAEQHKHTLKAEQQKHKARAVEGGTDVGSKIASLFETEHSAMRQCSRLLWPINKLVIMLRTMYERVAEKHGYRIHEITSQLEEHCREHAEELVSDAVGVVIDQERFVRSLALYFFDGGYIPNESKPESVV